MQWTMKALQAVIRNTVYRMLPYSVVSADGWGRFTSIQDAIDAADAGSASHWIIVKSGTYPNPITVSGDGFRIEGTGRRTLITNEGATASPAITISGDYNSIEYLAAKTEGGGGGGDQSAFFITGSWNGVRRNWVQDSDNSGFTITTGTDNDVSENVVEQADNIGINPSSSARQMIRGNRIDGVAGDGIQVGGSGDNVMVNDNHVDGSIVLASGADNSVAVGNISDEALTDSSTGSTVTGNEQY